MFFLKPVTRGLRKAGSCGACLPIADDGVRYAFGPGDKEIVEIIIEYPAETPVEDKTEREKRHGQKNQISQKEFEPYGPKEHA